MRTFLPGRHRAPLTPDEEVAERYADRTGWLFEIAQETGNRSLRALALSMKAEAKATREDQRRKR